ncbi:hypothetical protein Ancab_024890 [Ancistrocladus abbreviatus]
MVGSSDAGQPGEVMNMYHRMRQEGFECNENTFMFMMLSVELLATRMPVNQLTSATALAACASPEFLAEGKVVHALAVVAGFQMI